MSTVLRAALIDLHGIQASHPHIRAHVHKLVCASKPTVKLARVDTALLLTTQEHFVDSEDQDQTAYSVQSDL